MRRLLALGAVLLAGGIAFVTLGDGDPYTVRAVFADASGLRKDFDVKIDGVPVGRVASVELDEGDRAIATLELDEGAAPVGHGVRAVIRPTNLIGEKFVDISVGDSARPLASGVVIPLERTGAPVELDDLLDTLDLDTREALRVFVAEQGEAFVGRGRDLGRVLTRMPRSLDRTGELISALADENRALGRLIEESDRIVSAVARERRPLGRLVASAAGTLDTLAGRRRALGETVRRAPAMLAAARRSLTALEGAAVPLVPASRGLRASAPAMTAMLRELPAFAAAARPALRTARRVAPTLTRMGDEGTSVVRRLVPLAATLGEFASASDGFTSTLDEAIDPLLRVIESWARTTQQRDLTGYLFRGALEEQNSRVGDRTPSASGRERSRDPGGAARGVESTPSQPPELPRLRPLPELPTRPGTRLPGGAAPERGEQQDAHPLLDFLLGP